MSQTLVHIQSVQDDYDARASEIERYFSFLEMMDAGQKDISHALRAKSVDEADLFKTLKANFFLLLYNLMEAVTKNTIQGIYDHLRGQNARYDDCCVCLKKVVFKNIKREMTVLSIVESKAPHNLIFDRQQDIADHIMAEAFLVKNLLSGSVDAKALRELAEDFGLHPVKGSRDKNPERLVTVKSRRNKLAHGEQTFNEVGKDYSILELKDTKESVLNYMQQFVLNVDDYLSKRQYLANP